jgi:hypothetical protein
VDKTKGREIARAVLSAQDACNPRALARILVDALDYFCAEGTERGNCPEVRMLVDKLASLTGGCGIVTYHIDSEAFKNDSEECAKRSQAFYIKTVKRLTETVFVVEAGSPAEALKTSGKYLGYTDHNDFEVSVSEPFDFLTDAFNSPAAQVESL